jgi:RNA polymerase sigma-70 factor (ECF subfamily)
MDNSTPAIDESELGVRLVQGDTDVLTFLTLFLIARLPRLRLRSYGLDPNEIEDVVEESLCKVWEHRTTFRPDLGQLGPWCDAILRNTAIDLYRQKQRQLPDRIPLPDDLAKSPAETNPSADDEKAAHQHLVELLASLTDSDRRILDAHANDPDGPWAANVAPQLGMTPVAVRVRRFRLVQRLRAELLARNYPLAFHTEVIHGLFRKED